MKNKYCLLFPVVFLLFSCQMFSDVDYEYKIYKRVVGKQGGIFYFFSNYSNDNELLNEDTTNYLLRLNVPQGALDTQVVFNFYQFQDFQTACDLSEGYSCVGSQFFYFVPFLYSSGYHEHDGADLSYHETFNFKKPIEVKYYFSKFTNPKTIDEKKLKYTYYDRINTSYKVYKIRIPAFGQWGQSRNIFIELNKQGYPVGYNKSDLKDIILGYWQPFSNNNKEVSLANWESVENYNIDFENNTVSFQIENTDYIYVIAKLILIQNNDLPAKIVNFVQALGKTIQRASLENKVYNVYTNDNDLMIFHLNGDFYYSLKKNISIPTNVFVYINNNYPTTKILSNELFDYSNTKVLYIKTLTQLFAFQGEQISDLQFVYSSEYNVDISKLPQNVIANIYQKFENPIIKYFNKNSNLSSTFFTIYLTSQGMNIEYTVDNLLTISSIKYIGFEFSEIPDTVLKIITKYFENINLKSVTKSVDAENIEFDIYLLNDGYFKIKDDGTLRFCYFYIQQNKIPLEIIYTLNNFASNILSESYYMYDFSQSYPERYFLEFKEGLIAEINSNSEILYLYSKLYLDIPQKIRTYIDANFNSQEFIDYYFENNFYEGQTDYFYYVYLTENRILVFDKNGNYLGMMNKMASTLTKEKQQYRKMYFNKNIGQ